MSSKIIIIATVALFIAGLSVLFAVESVNHDYDHNKNWSVVYFNNPSDNSLDFTIENHQGEDKNYEYSYQANGVEVNSGKVDVSAGEKNIIELSQESKNKIIGMKKSGEILRVFADVKLNNAEYKIYKEY